MARCAERPDVRAISVAAQCHGLVLLDERGEVLRAAKLWNDTTGAANPSPAWSSASAPAAG